MVQEPAGLLHVPEDPGRHFHSYCFTDEHTVDCLLKSYMGITLNGLLLHVLAISIYETANSGIICDVFFLLFDTSGKANMQPSVLIR